MPMKIPIYYKFNFAKIEKKIQINWTFYKDILD